MLAAPAAPGDRVEVATVPLPSVTVVIAVAATVGFISVDVAFRPVRVALATALGLNTSDDEDDDEGDDEELHDEWLDDDDE